MKVTQLNSSIPWMPPTMAGRDADALRDPTGDTGPGRARGTEHGSLTRRIALALLLVKLTQWAVLAATLATGPSAGLPAVTLGSHVVAGLWVASSFVFLLRRRWLGALSSVVYSVLSGFVAVTQIADGAQVAWSTLTAAGSIGITVTVVVAALQGQFHRPRLGAAAARGA